MSHGSHFRTSSHCTNATTCVEVASDSFFTSSYCESGQCVEVSFQTSSYCADNQCVEVGYQTSSQCNGATCVEVGFETSSFCSGGNCVEVGNSGTLVYVRDGKDKTGPVLSFDKDAWNGFLDGINNGDFN